MTHMNDKAKFLERLNGLREMAKGQGSQIEVDEVKAYFFEDALTEEQMELVFDYLLAQKIIVKGYVKLQTEPEEEAEFTEEEKAYLKEYEMDLKAIKDAKAGEVEELVRRMVLGDESAKGRLAEIYLKEVVRIAKKMYHPGVFLGDLIQEGNLGLVLGVECIAAAVNDDSSQKDVATIAHEVLESQIRQSIQALLEEYSEVSKRDKKMVEKVNQLDESIKALTEELGRKVSIDELAVYMGMEIEEIEDILKLMGEEPESEEEEA